MLVPSWSSKNLNINTYQNTYVRLGKPSEHYRRWTFFIFANFIYNLKTPTRFFKTNKTKVVIRIQKKENKETLLKHH